MHPEHRPPPSAQPSGGVVFTVSDYYRMLYLLHAVIYRCEATAPDAALLAMDVRKILTDVGARQGK